MYTVLGFASVFHELIEENWKKFCVEISSPLKITTAVIKNQYCIYILVTKYENEEIIKFNMSFPQGNQSQSVLICNQSSHML